MQKGEERTGNRIQQAVITLRLIQTLPQEPADFLSSHPPLATSVHSIRNTVHLGLTTVGLDICLGG